MCDQVIIGIPGGARSEVEVVSPLTLVPAEEPILASRLPRGYELYRVVGEWGCSCGVYYDENEDVEIAEDNATADLRRIAKYRKRGWSESRIARALGDHRAHRDAMDRNRASWCATQVAATQGLEQSLGRIAKTFPGGVFVLAHGPCRTEGYRQFPLAGGRRSPSKVRLGAPSLERETIVHFGAG
jgi:hypothetical protein